MATHDHAPTGWVKRLSEPLPTRDEDPLREANNNLRWVTLPDPDNPDLTVSEVIGAVMKVVYAVETGLCARPHRPMFMYAWIDEMASQFRVGFVTFGRRPPLGAPAVGVRLDTLAKAVVAASKRPGHIPWEDLRSEGDGQADAAGGHTVWMWGCRVG